MGNLIDYPFNIRKELEKMKSVQEDEDVFLKFYQQIDVTTSKLLRTNIILPFMLELLNYKIVLTKSLPTAAAVRSDTETIYINPFNEIFQSYETIEILAFVLLHEVCHILLRHSKRIKHREHLHWNWACDFVINYLLQSISKECRVGNHGKKAILNCDRHQYAKSFLIHSSFDNMLEEEVYEHIIKNNKKIKEYTIPMSDLMDDDLNSSGSPGDNNKDQEDNNQTSEFQSGDENKGEIKVTETEFKIEGQSYKHTDIQFPKINFSPSKRKEKEKNKDQRIGLNRQLIETSLSKGVTSNSLKKFLKKLFDVKIDWEKIVADSIATTLEKSTEMSWSSPRTTWLANATKLPYLPNVEEEEKFGTVFVSIDESGSMGDDDVRAAVSIIIQASNYYKNLYVVKHDTDIHWQKKYEKNEVDIDELLIRRHSGGTSHRDVFTRANEYLKEDPDGMISCFISITDMYSDIHETQYLLPSNIPRVYIVNVELSEVYNTENILGRIISIK